MRIAIDLSPAVHQKAGLGRYAASLAEQLVAQDTQNEYLVFSRNYSASALPPTLQSLPHANVRMDVRPFRMAIWLAHVLGVTLDRMLPKVDVFHATEHLLPPLKNAKSVLTIHDLIFRLYPEYHLPLNHRFLTNAVPYFLRRADAIIAVSECTRRDMIRFYQIPEGKITVVYEGVSPALHPVTNPERIAAARERYARNCPFILFVSTIEPRKNIPALVDAVRLLHDKGLPHRLVLSGRKGWLYEGIFEHIKKSGIESLVDYTYIPDEDLPSMLAACDVFAFPSLYEGFGLTPLEAMACGAPVVCSNTSSLPEVVGDAALLVNPKEVRDLAAAIERVIRDEPLRAQLRARGMQQASKFTWERAARETLAVYERVAMSQAWRSGVS